MEVIPTMKAVLLDDVDLTSAIPTFIGSVLSMFAAGSIFACYMILPPRKHFRHTLILNLAAADFVNAFNNTVSGLYSLIYREQGGIPNGHWCVFNGMIGQLTVQATDFTILAIAIATVITLNSSDFKARTSGLKTKILVTAAIWFVPFVTSVIALIWSAYVPVSGNWCWIDPRDAVLRYALGHGWRISIIISVITLYTYLIIHIHRHFSNLRSVAAKLRNQASETGNPNQIYLYDEFELVIEDETDLWEADPSYRGTDFDSAAGFPIHPSDVQKARHPSGRSDSPPLSPFRVVKQTFHSNATSSEKIHSTGGASHSESSNPFLPKRSSLMTRDPLALVRRPQQLPAAQYAHKHGNLATAAPTIPPASEFWERERRIQKLLLLNAYPIGYVLLWVPGILNRLLELGGKSYPALEIAQSSTQFVGLVNALVYGYNERIWSLAITWIRDSKQRNADKAQRAGELEIWHEAEAQLEQRNFEDTITTRGPRAAEHQKANDEARAGIIRIGTWV